MHLTPQQIRLKCFTMSRIKEQSKVFNLFFQFLYFDFLKTKTASVKEAIIKTGAQRLRPVLLTTTTTVLGLLPMVTMTNIDFVTREVTRGSPDTQWWVQLSTAIVFGLIFATILTLIVTPSALMLKENVVNWYRNKAKS